MGSRRPSSVTAVAIAFILLAALIALAGFTASAVSSCCGSSDPADPAPALLGIGMATAMCAVGIGLLSGRVSRRVLLLCAAVVPVAIVAVSPRSADLAGLLPFALVGWLWLSWYLRRPVAREWLGGDAVAPPHDK